MKTKTFLRYFFSYFMILCTLLLCFSFIVHNQLIKNYTTQMNSSINERLTVATESFSNFLSSISYTHTSLRNNIVLSNYYYETSTATRHTLYTELCKYDSINPYIDAIIILNKSNGDTLSSNYLTKYTDGIIYIYDNNGLPTSITVEQIDTIPNKLFSPQNNSSNYLFYVPNTAGDVYTFVYSINLMELTTMLKNNLVEGISSFALISPDHLQIYGTNTENIDLEKTKTFTESGIYEYSSNYSIYYQADIYQGYAMCVLFSNEAFAAQLHEAFITAYISFFAICIVGVFAIFLCMRLTYYPLKTVILKHVDTHAYNSDFLQQIDNAFSTSTSERIHLQEKLDMYQLSIQKALYKSTIDDNTAFNFHDIDNIFHSESNNYTYIIRMFSSKSNFAEREILNFLMNNLNRPSDAIILETGNTYRVLLINYISTDPIKDDVPLSTFSEICDKFGYYCAISSMGTSIIDIPTQYENALEASRYWSQSPVVSFSLTASHEVVKENSTTLYKLLKEFNIALNTSDFTVAHIQLELFISKTDYLLLTKSDYPIFIIRSLIIEILMMLFVSMNRSNINFKLYDELYYQTLSYAQNYDLFEIKQDIFNNLFHLLKIFESENQNIRINQIATYLEENFSSEDLSITTLADHFHVSVAYMSYLFKKEFDQNFIDYLWELRFQKATDMLLNTDLSVDTISTHIGYVNPSSFRRKFKQHTGQTPLQYRNNSKEDPDT